MVIYPTYTRHIPHITVFHWNRCFLTDKVPSGSGPIFSKAVRDRMPCPSHFLPSCRLLHGLSHPILAHEDCQEAPLVRRATGSSHCFHPSLAEGLFLKRRLSKISQPYRTPPQGRFRKENEKMIHWRNLGNLYPIFRQAHWRGGCVGVYGDGITKAQEKGWDHDANHNENSW
jgi:hypothetical protein